MREGSVNESLSPVTSRSQCIELEKGLKVRSRFHFQCLLESQK